MAVSEWLHNLCRHPFMLRTNPKIQEEFAF
jgi:hypothetical protein